MAHKRTKRPQPKLPLTGYCPDCDKIRYMSRADARRAAHTIGRRSRAYQCPADGTFWHLTSWQPAGRVAYYRSKEAGTNGQGT